MDPTHGENADVPRDAAKPCGRGTNGMGQAQGCCSADTVVLLWGSDPAKVGLVPVVICSTSSPQPAARTEDTSGESLTIPVLQLPDWILGHISSQKEC